MQSKTKDLIPGFLCKPLVENSNLFAKHPVGRAHKGTPVMVFFALIEAFQLVDSILIG